MPHETARCITEGYGWALLENTVLETDRPSVASEECVLVEADGGMIPIVQRDPKSADKRKGKTLEWKELKLCIATMSHPPMAVHFPVMSVKLGNTCSIVPGGQV